MKKAIPMFAFAILFIGLAFMRLPDTFRAVDTISLLGAGLLAGVLLMTGINSIRSDG